LKAVVFEDKEVASYKEVDEPRIEDNEVLIKVKYCGICGTDIALYRGDMPYMTIGMQNYPLIPGHEWSGEVVKTGPGVKNLKKGDRVTGDVTIGCTKCRNCMEGRFNLCPNRYEVGCYRNRQGGMAEYIAMPERHTYKFSENIDFMGGAIVEPLATAVHGLARKKIGYDENILITGTGLIGILAAQVAQLNKSSRVILSGRTRSKLDAARESGVENIINIRENDIKQELKKMGLLDDIDFCVECSGNINALKQCIELVKAGGDISIIGFYENFTEVVNFDDISIKNLEIHGVLASPNFFRPTLNLLEKNLINYKPLISKVFELGEINQAIDYVTDKDNESIKVMLKVG